jgi:hypothetical protein
MIGAPKHLNTKDDYEYAHALATEGKIPADAMRKQWEGLLATRQVYAYDRDLGATEDPDGPEPEYRVITDTAEDGTETRKQYKLGPNPGAAIDRLGYTVAEVEAKLAELGG